MKSLFVGQAQAWLRLAGAVAVLALASYLTQPSPVSKIAQLGLASLPKPGSMKEW